MQIPINVDAYVDPQDMARMVNPEDAVEFVIELDRAFQSWDFTLALCDHFEKLREEHKREVAEDEAKRAIAVTP